MKKVTKYCWIGGTIGMVVVETPHETKAYIKSISGYSEEADIKDVANWGTNLPFDEALSLMETWGVNECEMEID